MGNRVMKDGETRFASERAKVEMAGIVGFGTICTKSRAVRRAGIETYAQATARPSQSPGCKARTYN